MSQELLFCETLNGEWFYILENRDAPDDAWDWMEYAQAFGPFESYEAAAGHEHQSDSDTSGAMIVKYQDGSLPLMARQMIASLRGVPYGSV